MKNQTQAKNGQSPGFSRAKVMPDATEEMNEMDYISGKLGGLNMSVGATVRSSDDLDGNDSKFYTDHARNCTGISGPRLWSDDEEVNKLWDKYGKPISNGMEKYQDGLLMRLLGRYSLGSTSVRSTCCDNFGQNPFQL